MGGSCVRVRRPRIRGTRQTRRSPTHSHHKINAGRRSVVVAFMLLGYTRIVRAAKPYRQAMPATGRTISADLACCNASVGRALNPQPMRSNCGSRACPRWRCVSRRKEWLIHRYRGQARLPQGLAVCLRGWTTHELSLGLSDITYEQKRS